MGHMEGLRKLSHKKAAIATAGVLGILGAASTASAADFQHNFEAFTPGAGETVVSTLLDCRFSAPAGSAFTFVADGKVGDACARGDNSEDPDHTPFFEETITTANGNMYYHVIVGDPDSDFAQEYYIQAGWGAWLEYGNFPKTASDGGLNGGIDATPTWMAAEFASPLDNTLGGNGTGAPEKVTFRQIVRSPGFEQEMLKSKLAYKPVIVQTVDDDEMDSDFSVDMSNIDYNDDTTTGEIINTMTIIDKDTGYVWTDFDMHKAPKSYTSNAKYTVSGGTGVAQLQWYYETFMGMSPEVAEAEARKGAQATSPDYNYAGEADFDVYAVDWAAYWNADENVPDI